MNLLVGWQPRSLAELSFRLLIPVKDIGGNGNLGNPVSLGHGCFDALARSLSSTHAGPVILVTKYHTLNYLARVAVQFHLHPLRPVSIELKKKKQTRA